MDTAGPPRAHRKRPRRRDDQFPVRGSGLDEGGDAECDEDRYRVEHQELVERFTDRRWTALRVIAMRHDSIYAAYDCALALAVAGSHHFVELGACSGEPSAGGLAGLVFDIDEVRAADLIPGGGKELLVRWHVTKDGATTPRWLLCGIGPSRSVSCHTGDGAAPSKRTFFP